MLSKLLNSLQLKEESPVVHFLKNWMIINMIMLNLSTFVSSKKKLELNWTWHSVKLNWNSHAIIQLFLSIIYFTVFDIACEFLLIELKISVKKLFASNLLTQAYTYLHSRREHFKTMKHLFLASVIKKFEFSNFWSL